MGVVVTSSLGALPSSTITIEDHARPGWAFRAARAARAKHVGIVEPETVPLAVTGGCVSNSNVAE